MPDPSVVVVVKEGPVRFTVASGYPLVPIGVGDGYAWTLTSGGTDNSDIFAEQLDPADPTRYLFDGEYRTMDCRVEEIGVAGAAAERHVYMDL